VDLEFDVPADQLRDEIELHDSGFSNGALVSLGHPGVPPTSGSAGI
jgi:hypothetical protein